MWTDATVTRHIGGRPSTHEEVWGRLLRYAGHWAWLGFGYWVLEDAATGRFVGEAGFADFRRAITPSFEGAPESGWVLAPWAHGRGLATEAVRAVIAWGDQRFSGARTVCMIAPANTASLRVATKCGYVEERRATYGGHETIVLSRTTKPAGA